MHRRSRSWGLPLLTVCTLLWPVGSLTASNTYKPPLPPRLNKAYLTGKKLWKSKKIVGPGGDTCAGCHESGDGPELQSLELIRKREDLAKLIYFELVSRSGNSLVKPDGPEVEALEVYLTKRFKLDSAAPVPASDEAGNRLAEARELYSKGDFSAALTTLEEVLGASPPQQQKAEAHLLLGVIAQVLGDTTRARAEFYSVFRLEPQAQLDPEIFSPKTIELFESVRAAVVGAPQENG